MVVSDQGGEIIQIRGSGFHESIECKFENKETDSETTSLIEQGMYNI